MYASRSLSVLRTPVSLVRQPMRMSLAARPFVRALGTIPQPAGGIVGTVNEAVPVPPASPSHGSYHWSFERLFAVGLVPLTILPFATGSALSPVLDAVLMATMGIHSFIGFQACIIDYIPKRVYGKLHDFAMYLLVAGTGLLGFGAYKFETEDVGLTATIGKIWKA
ncbi:CybS-domain-containing protein [Dipodascopsis tothii]|uniref:CybS-domain-containing protein n=1 Tax=Dipodascopsis tothii TaxID=44089 RepID=UPI0034CED600